MTYSVTQMSVESWECVVLGHGVLGYRLGSCLLSHGEGEKASVRWELPQSSAWEGLHPETC